MCYSSVYGAIMVKPQYLMRFLKYAILAIRATFLGKFAGFAPPGFRVNHIFFTNVAAA